MSAIALTLGVPAFAGTTSVLVAASAHEPPAPRRHHRGGHTLVLDQASKLWLLYVFDLARRGAVKVTPFFDLVLAWNIGISFGWFQNDGQLAQVVLMAIKVVAVVVLAIWMARSQHPAGDRRARPDHRRRHRQRHRPLRLWRGGRFRPVPRRDRRKNLSIGTCLTLRMWPLLPGWRPYCMIPSWGYPPQKRPDPGRYGPSGLELLLPARGSAPRWRDKLARNLEQERARCADRRPAVRWCGRPRWIAGVEVRRDRPRHRPRDGRRRRYAPATTTMRTTRPSRRRSSKHHGRHRRHQHGKHAASTTASARRWWCRPSSICRRPAGTSAEVKAPNWPKDPDEQRRKAAIAARKKANKGPRLRSRPHPDAARTRGGQDGRPRAQGQRSGAAGQLNTNPIAQPVAARL